MRVVDGSVDDEKQSSTCHTREQIEVIAVPSTMTLIN